MKVTEEEREKIENSTRHQGRSGGKTEMVSFGGISRREDGTLTRSNYFRFLEHNLDDYTDIEFTPKQAKKVHAHLLKLSTGASAMTPMYCGGEICPFSDRCVLFGMNKHPLGKQCLIEVELMRQWTVDFMEEFDVDPSITTEVAYANELAELAVLERRVNMNLARASNAELVVDQTVGVDRDGDPIMQKVISPFMELKDKISNRRSKIIKLMVGDRQEKYKMEAALKMKLEDDPSSKMAAMRTKLESFARQLNTMETDARSSTDGGTMSPEDIINAE